MAKQFAMTLHGAEGLEEVLLSISRSLSREVLKTALMKSATPFTESAVRNLKSQVRNRSGVLLGRTQTGVFVGSVLSKNQRRGKRIARGVTEIYVGPYKARHAHLIEFGTGPRFTKTGAARGALRPRPFMRPAWEEHKMGILGSLGSEIWATLEKEAKRVARSQKRQLAKAAKR